MKKYFIKMLCFSLLAVVLSIFIMKISANSTESQKYYPPHEIQNAISEKPLKLWMPYDTEKSEELDNLESKYVFIQAKDLKEIQDSKNPVKTVSDTPPINFQLSAVTYNANVKDDYINISGTYNINKLDDEWTLIPIISDQIGLSSAMLNGKPAFMTTLKMKLDLSKFKNASKIRHGYYFLALKDKGNHVLKTNFSVKLNKAASINTKSFYFNLPYIPIVNLRCNINQKNLEFQVPKAVSVASKNTAAGSELFASFPPLKNIQIKWNPKSSVFDDSKNLQQKTKPSVSVITYSKMELGKGSLKGKFIADIDVRRTALNHFDFYIPDDIDIDSIIVDDNELIDAYPPVVNNVLPIDLAAAVEGKVKITINYRKNFHDSSFKTQVPSITLVNKNIDKETGYVAILETTNIESSIIESDKIKTYKKIDSTELIGPLRGTNASIAFKYLKNKDKITEIPYDVVIKVVKHQEVAVFEANIDSEDITSIISRDGKMLTKSIFKVRNTKKQFLNIKLPKNSSIWSVYVDGKPAKPALIDESRNLYAIPLAKSVSSAARSKAFPVEVVYYTEKVLLSPSWLGGFSNIKAVSSELVANSINWKIYFPEKIKFLNIGLFSNLKQEKQKKKAFLKNQIEGFMDDSMQIESTTSSYSLKKSKIQRAMTLAPSMDIGARAKIDQVYKSKKTGKLPIYINLPIIGEGTGFYQLSFEANKYPSISAFYFNTAVVDYLILGLIVLLIAVLIKPFNSKQFKTAQFVLPCIALVFLAYQLLGLYLLGAVGLYALYFSTKKILALPDNKKKKTFKIVGSLLVLIIGFILASMLHFLPFYIGLLVVIVLFATLGSFCWNFIALVFNKLKSIFQKKKENESSTRSNTEEQK